MFSLVLLLCTVVVPLCSVVVALCTVVVLLCTVAVLQYYYTYDRGTMCSLTVPHPGESVSDHEAPSSAAERGEAVSLPPLHQHAAVRRHRYAPYTIVLLYISFILPLWSTTEYYVVLCSTMEYHGLLWSIMGYYGVPWGTMKYYVVLYSM